MTYNWSEIKPYTEKMVGSHQFCDFSRLSEEEEVQKILEYVGNKTISYLHEEYDKIVSPYFIGMRYLLNIVTALEECSTDSTHDQYFGRVRLQTKAEDIISLLKEQSGESLSGVLFVADKDVPGHFIDGLKAQGAIQLGNDDDYQTSKEGSAYFVKQNYVFFAINSRKFFRDESAREHLYTLSYDCATNTEEKGYVTITTRSFADIESVLMCIDPRIRKFAHCQTKKFHVKIVVKDSDQKIVSLLKEVGKKLDRQLFTVEYVEDGRWAADANQQSPQNAVFFIWANNEEIKQPLSSNNSVTIPVETDRYIEIHSEESNKLAPFARRVVRIVFEPPKKVGSQSEDSIPISRPSSISPQYPPSPNRSRPSSTTTIQQFEEEMPQEGTSGGTSTTRLPHLPPRPPRPQSRPRTNEIVSEGSEGTESKRPAKPSSMRPPSTKE